MRPNTALEPSQSLSRKSSTAETRPSIEDRRHATPMTFFLARGSDPFETREEPVQTSSNKTSPVRSLKDTIEEASQASAVLRAKDEDTNGLSRRRSTIKAPTPQASRRESSSHSPASAPRRDGALTPLLLPSRDTSLPSSPKSVSSRSIQKSEDGSASDAGRSQAIVSSDDEDQENPAAIQDSAPQLIMPSIRMPSRRPFTERGKRLGRYKVLVAGCKGSGKTSLIKSMVQLCEDIVHVDPLSNANDSKTEKDKQPSSSQPCMEIYASTKPYPSWWSDLDESKILKRRKSMGDSVLERNICFVEASNSSRVDTVIHYIEQQLQRAFSSCALSNNDLGALLSGRGGSQVDIILYLLSKDTLQTDCAKIQQLSEIANVVPLISKADAAGEDEIVQLKQAGISLSSAILKLPVFDSSTRGVDIHIISAPFTASSASGRDTETMDASLLMSPEYVQPLVPSELAFLTEQLFDPDVIAYLRHTAAKKLIAWHASHPRLISQPSSSITSAPQSTLASPMPTSLTNSGVLIPVSSTLSLSPSNNYALARVADHTQREERLAQVRLSKWASDLQTSLQRERERYEKLARGDRAMWLIERMGEEVREGQVLPMDSSQALVRNGQVHRLPGGVGYATQDPLGLLRWQDLMRTRGWIALQVVGSFGVVGGLAFWLARTFGLGATLQQWSQEWSSGLFGTTE